jgi:hypothetical protein
MPGNTQPQGRAQLVQIDIGRPDRERVAQRGVEVEDLPSRDRLDLDLSRESRLEA